jgi:hypothetical protein
MARRATKDTYATEDMGGGTLVRRKVFAGTEVPDHYEVEDKGSVEGDTTVEAAAKREQEAVDAGTQDADTSKTGVTRKKS